MGPRLATSPALAACSRASTRSCVGGCVRSAPESRPKKPTFPLAAFVSLGPSEIIAFAHRTEVLAALGCEVVAISTDSHFTHTAWRNTPVEQGGVGSVPFPMVADMTREITSAYGVLSEPGNSYYPAGVAMRATFVIDQQGIVRHQIVNDEPLGRSVDEVIRIVDALQFFEEHGQVCPAGWNKGDAGMVTTSWGVASYLSEHADAL